MTPQVFANYSQSELDAQYDNQRACLEFAAILASAKQMSLSASSLNGERNVRWGNDERESLDVYLPASAVEKPLPVVVYIHGGAWLILDKESSAFAAPAVVADDCIFVALGFHTAATLDFATMVARVRAGVAWLIGNIARYGGDPARIVMVGHSSGTHLVSQCLDLDGVSAALMVSGLCDLEPVRLSYRNKRLNLSEADVVRYSLVHNQAPITAAVTVAVAESDTAEFRRQAKEMATYFRQRGNLRESFTAPGKNHFDVILDLVDSNSKLFRSLSDLAHRRDRQSEQVSVPSESIHP